VIPHAMEAVNKLYNQGHTILIWTCRDGDFAEEAKEALDLHGFKYHKFNENAEDRIEKYGWDSRKLGADIYIDDKTPFCLINGVDWNVLYEMIQQCIKKHYAHQADCIKS